MTFIFKMKRRPDFFFVNVILPFAMMGVLNLLVFILPHESGERVGYSITILLAISVFLTITADHLPQTSYPTVPLLSIKLLVDMVISSFVLLFTILTIRFYNMEETKEIPQWMAVVAQWLTHCCRKPVRCGRVRQTATIGCSKVDINNDVVDVDIEGMKESHSLDMTWNTIGKASDIFFFVVTLLAFTISHCTYIAYMWFK